MPSIVKGSLSLLWQHNKPPLLGTVDNVSALLHGLLILVLHLDDGEGQQAVPGAPVHLGELEGGARWQFNRKKESLLSMLESAEVSWCFDSAVLPTLVGRLNSSTAGRKGERN